MPLTSAAEVRAGGKSPTGTGSKESGRNGGMTVRTDCFLQECCGTGEQNVKLSEGVILGFYKAGVLFVY